MFKILVSECQCYYLMFISKTKTIKSRSFIANFRVSAFNINSLFADLGIPI